MKLFCRHDWTKWSQQIPTYHGVNQFRYCIKCNKVKKRFHHNASGAYSNDHNLGVWNNPKSDADELKANNE